MAGASDRYVADMRTPMRGLTRPPNEFFYPFGNTPPTNLLRSLDADSHDVLQLGAGDLRSFLYTLWSVPSTAPVPRHLTFSMVDLEPSTFARNLICMRLMLDLSSPDGDDLAPAALATLWDAYYNIAVRPTTVAAAAAAASALITASTSPEAWAQSDIGIIVRFPDAKTLALVRECWQAYATEKFDLKTYAPARSAFLKKHLKEAGITDDITVFPRERACWLGGKTYIEPFSALSIRYSKELRLAPPAEADDGALVLNPLMAVMNRQEGSINVLTCAAQAHYGSFPIDAFASALPGDARSGTASASPSAKRMHECLYDLRSWAHSFIRVVRREQPFDVRVYLYASDALAVCDALLVQPLPESYGGTRVDAPARFDVIDTSNLSDHLGLAHLLIVASPLIKPAQPHACVMTDSISSKTSLGADCVLADMAAMSVNQLALLVGLVPTDSLFGSALNFDITMPGVPAPSQCRVEWKPAFTMDSAMLSCLQQAPPAVDGSPAALSVHRGLPPPLDLAEWSDFERLTVSVFRRMVASKLSKQTASKATMESLQRPRHYNPLSFWRLLLLSMRTFRVLLPHVQGMYRALIAKGGMFPTQNALQELQTWGELLGMARSGQSDPTVVYTEKSLKEWLRVDNYSLIPGNRILSMPIGDRLPYVRVSLLLPVGKTSTMNQLLRVTSVFLDVRGTMAANSYYVGDITYVRKRKKSKAPLDYAILEPCSMNDPAAQVLVSVIAPTLLFLVAPDNTITVNLHTDPFKVREVRKVGGTNCINSAGCVFSGTHPKDVVVTCFSQKQWRCSQAVPHTVSASAVPFLEQCPPLPLVHRRVFDRSLSDTAVADHLPADSPRELRLKREQEAVLRISKVKHSTWASNAAPLSVNGKMNPGGLLVGADASTAVKATPIKVHVTSSEAVRFSVDLTAADAGLQTLLAACDQPLVSSTSPCSISVTVHPASSTLPVADAGATPSCAQCDAELGGEGAARMRCSKCKAVYYCSAEHQRAHWREGHKRACSPPHNGKPLTVVVFFPMPVNGDNVQMKFSRKRFYISLTVHVQLRVATDFPLCVTKLSAGDDACLRTSCWNLPRLDLDKMALLDARAPVTKRVLFPACGAAFSPAEKQIIKGGGRQSPQLAYKTSVHSIAQYFYDNALPGKFVNVGIGKPGRAPDTFMAMHINGMRWHAEAGVPIIDACVIPLEHSFVAEVGQRLASMAPWSICVNEEEARYWRGILPSMCERVRVGYSHHGASCAYSKKGVPVSYVMGEAVLCGCSAGKNLPAAFTSAHPQAFTSRFHRVGIHFMYPARQQLRFDKEDTREATTAASMYEQLSRMADSEASLGEGQREQSLKTRLRKLAEGKLCHVCGMAGPLKCARCEQARYCSAAHQKQHWSTHKAQCKAATSK